MAKGKKKAAKKSSGSGHRTVARPKFAGNQYDCYGKRVKAGRGKKKVARVFCARVA